MAETGRRRAATVDRNEEQQFAAGLVGLVDISAPEEHAVLNGEGREVAAADAEHRQRRIGCRGVGLRPRPVRSRERGDRLPRRKQEVFQRVRSDDVVERSGRRIMTQPVGAPVLFVEPARGEFRDRRQFAEHDRTIRDLRSDNAMPTPPEGVDQLLQSSRVKPVPGAGEWCGHRCLVSSLVASTVGGWAPRCNCRVRAAAPPRPRCLVHHVS